MLLTTLVLIHSIILSLPSSSSSSSCASGFSELHFHPISSPTRSMYPHSVNKFSRADDFLGYLPSPDAGSAPEMPWQYQVEWEVRLNSWNSGGSSYGSPSSQRSSEGVMQRSGVYHPVSALFSELMEESEEGPVRKVYSTGDLQRMNAMQYNRHSESPLSSESSMIIEGMSRAYPYSPEEKKVRIERYRIKRNKRNFDKKIKYACRKTLADSRPRIRGRFAKIEKIDKKSHIIGHGEEDEEEDENWTNFFETLVAANLIQEP